MAIYRLSKWRPSTILELYYHHTRPPTKSLLLAAAVCQTSCQSNSQIWRRSDRRTDWGSRRYHAVCQSDTQIWRYSYLNFSHIWLKMPIQAPKIGFWGLWTPKCDYSSSRSTKGTSLRKSASLKLSTVKIRWGVWLVGELTENGTDTHTHRHTDRHTQVNLYSVHA